MSAGASSRPAAVGERGPCRGEAAANGALHRRGPAGVGPGAGEVEAGDEVRVPGRRRRLPGAARKVARGSRVTVKSSTRRVARGRKKPRERGQVALPQRRDRLAELGDGGRERDRDELALGDARRGGAVEQPLHRRADGGRERLVEHAAVVVHVQVHDRARAERLERLGVDGSRRHELARPPGAARRRRPRRPPRFRPRAAARPGANGANRRARAATRAPARSSAAAAASPCRRWSGTVETPMSAAPAESSRPVRKTCTAAPSDASSAGRFSVGRAIRFQSASIAAGLWPCARSQSPKVCSSSAGSSGSSFRSAAAARTAARRSRGLSSG